MTTTAAITSRIQYNRANRDYDCFVTIDGEEQYIGSASTYSEGESKCNAYAYDHYSDNHDNHTPEVAAAIALGDVVVVDETEACIECDGEGRVPAHGCGDQAGGWAETCDFCNGTGKAVDPELPSIFRPVPAPDLLAEVDTILDSAALDDLWRTSGIEWERRSARIRANVMARIATQATCRNCGAGHTIQKCPEVRALLFAPVVERVLERVA